MFRNYISEQGLTGLEPPPHCDAPGTGRRCTVEEVIGAEPVGAIAALFASRVDAIKIRRVQAGGGTLIKFHTDHSLKTMQIPLNGEHEYAGGRLTFVTKSGLLQPRRPAGSATIHDRTIAHGVTALTAGTRYSLFFLDHGRERRETFNRNTTPPRGKELAAAGENDAP